MRLLLDTNIWLFMHAAPERLSPEGRQRLEAPQTECVFSSVVAWEIAIKVGIGKLTLPEPPDRYVRDRLHSMPMAILPVSVAHALRVAELPGHHNDPFDRLLVAQAQCEGLHLMSADQQLSAYDIQLQGA